MCVWLCLACVLWPTNHEPVYGIRHIGEQIIRGCASAVLRDCNMIELVHAKLTHTYAATRRPSGMHVGHASVSLSDFSDLFEPPEEGKGIGFPRKHVILADCTTWENKLHEAQYSINCEKSDFVFAAPGSKFSNHDFGSASENAFPGIFDDLCDPVILTNTGCYSTHQSHLWDIYIYIYIYAYIYLYTSIYTCIYTTHF